MTVNTVAPTKKAWKSPGPGRVQCVATSKFSGNQCRHSAIPGGKVCRYHGGSAPQVKAAAARRLARTNLENAVRTMGLPLDVTPGEAMLQEVRRSAGAVAWLAEEVAAVQDVAYTDADGVERERVLLEMYRAERTHLVRAAKAASDAGIAQERIELEKTQVTMLGTGLLWLLSEAGVDTPQTRALAAHMMRALDVGVNPAELPIGSFVQGEVVG